LQLLLSLPPSDLAPPQNIHSILHIILHMASTASLHMNYGEGENAEKATVGRVTLGS
jgi:hypothetical protein